MSASVTVSVPPVAMLPPTTPTSSVTEPVPAEITAASLVPLIVTTTDDVVPSADVTVNVSVSVSPAPRAWMAGLVLDAV